jgi:hypothetical protein
MAIKYHGKRGLIYVSTSAAGTLVLVGGLRAFTLDGTQDQVDTTEFGASNRTSVLGFPAGRGTFEGFWASDDSTLAQASNSPDGCKIGIYPSRDAMTRYFACPAWVDYSARSAVDAAVTLTANWTANGNITNTL